MLRAKQTAWQVVWKADAAERKRCRCAGWGLAGRACTTPRHAMPHHATLRHAVPRRAAPRHATLCRTSSQHPTLRHASLRLTAPHYITLHQPQGRSSMHAASSKQSAHLRKSEAPPPQCGLLCLCIQMQSSLIKCQVVGACRLPPGSRLAAAGAGICDRKAFAEIGLKISGNVQAPVAAAPFGKFRRK